VNTVHCVGLQFGGLVLKQSKLISLFVLLLSVTLVSGCGLLRVSKVDNSHLLVQADLNRPHAKVYFIRPKTEHVAGYADNLLDVELDGKDLMKLGKAEYVLVYLKPRDVTITLRNRTQVRGRWEVAEMSQSRQFSFKADETYFIQTSMFDGEFRGARFIPEALSLFDARKAARYLAPAGLARQHPISKL